MSDIVSELIPVNLLSEKEHFLSDHTYNPQFQYHREFTDAELTAWGHPIPEIVSHSIKMLETHASVTNTDPYVTPEYIRAQITQFNQKYQLEKPVTVHFSPQQVTRCRVHELDIFFQVPIGYTHSTLADLFRHELETHILRRLNTQLQPWATEVKETKEFRRTEEGIAGLHTYLYRKNKLLRKSYLTYSAVAVAQSGSFTEVFTHLRRYGVSENTAWNISVRTKRGKTDTSQPGGFTKDLSYLEGGIQVWSWIMHPTHDPHDLYLGRIALEDIPKYKPHSVITALRYPEFMSDVSHYRELIQEIGLINKFDILSQHIDLQL